MDVLKAIYDRRSVREYTQQPLDKLTLHSLIEAAIQAPSAMNLQPWSFVVFVGGEYLSLLSAVAKGWRSGRGISKRAMRWLSRAVLSSASSAEMQADSRLLRRMMSRGEMQSIGEWQ